MKKNMNKILIADDDKLIRVSLCDVLQKEGFQTVEAVDGENAIEIFKKEQPSVIILDLIMPVLGGMEAISRIKEIDQTAPIIMMTAYGDIATAVEAMRLGVHDFITKPVEPGKLLFSVRGALEKLSTKREIDRLNTSEEALLEGTLGKSPEIRKVIQQIRQVAPSEFSVIVEGETGTGKSLVAKMLHDISSRAKKPFVRIDMGAIPETLVEGEIFGFERGAFTGAVLAKKGFFETADQGTVFIDDLENLSPQVQSKILNVVESKNICRLGNRESMMLDVRIIAATNKDIHESVAKGSFREDLFYRLGEFIITLPPLRTRRDDISFLALKFVEDAASELNKKVKGINSEAMKRLLDYQWPGNVRELKNVVKRAVLLCEQGEVRHEHLEFFIGRKSKGEELLSLMPLKEAVRRLERSHIKRAMDAAKGNKSVAASILKIDAKTLRAKLGEYETHMPTSRHKGG